MIDAAQATTACLACGNTIIQISGRGHRKRCYCDDVCRQRAHRARKKEQRYESWQEAQARIVELEDEIRKLQECLNIEALSWLLHSCMLG